MKPLNYCRQIVTQFEAAGDAPSEAYRAFAHTFHLGGEYFPQVPRLLRVAKKFVLPEEGELLPDPELRALEGMDFFPLPYPVVALEFPSLRETGIFSLPEGGHLHCTKRVVVLSTGETLFGADSPFCSENPSALVMASFGYVPSFGEWVPTSNYLLFSQERYVDREKSRRAGRTAYMLRVKGDSPRPTPKDVDAALGFLNALACSNVQVGSSPPRKRVKASKNALPFDTYYYLTIEVPGRPGVEGGLNLTTHQSPREHLRRGHIRRIQGGRPVWVNACVVSAGVGGRVEKDYVVRGARH